MEGVGGELLRVQVWGGDGCVQVGYFAGEERGEEGAYVVGEPRAGGDGVAHVDVVFGGGMPHAAGDGGGTPLDLEVRAGAGRGGAACSGEFFHAAADVGRGVPVCPFGELGGAYDAAELLACGCLDVGGGPWPAGVGSAYRLSYGAKIAATCPKYQS